MYEVSRESASRSSGQNLPIHDSSYQAFFIDQYSPNTVSAIIQNQAVLYLSFIHKKNKNYPDAVLLWQRMDRLSLGAVLPLVELAKYYEHTEKNIPKAMECSRRGLANARASGSKDMIKELEIRIQRLDRKMRKV